MSTIRDLDNRGVNKVFRKRKQKIPKKKHLFSDNLQQKTFRATWRMQEVSEHNESYRGAHVKQNRPDDESGSKLSRMAKTKELIWPASKHNLGQTGFYNWTYYQKLSTASRGIPMGVQNSSLVIVFIQRDKTTSENSRNRKGTFFDNFQQKTLERKSFGVKTCNGTKKYTHCFIVYSMQVNFFLFRHAEGAKLQMIRKGFWKLSFCREVMATIVSTKSANFRLTTENNQRFKRHRPRNIRVP